MMPPAYRRALSLRLAPLGEVAEVYAAVAERLGVADQRSSSQRAAVQ